jgi:uncharacterized protein
MIVASFRPTGQGQKMEFEVAEPQTISMTTPDGVRLDADLWRPAAPGPFPVLLMRQPYGRKIASTVVWAHPAWYAARGYIVVIQDVRGCGSSAGKFQLWQDEAADGQATLDWIATLPDTTGRVGMYGFSYQASTQLLAAASGRRGLACLSPAMPAFDVYADMAYEGGAFRLHQSLLWGVQMAADNARLAGDDAAYAAFIAASRSLPLTAAVPERPPILALLEKYGHYAKWLQNPKPGPYWAAMSASAQLGACDLPMLHIGGWFDSLLTGTLALWKHMAKSGAPQRLKIGPWTHLPWGRKVGERDFGASAARGMDRVQLAWFDHWLKGAPLPNEPAVELFEMGGDRWRGFSAWPEPAPTRYFLASDGLAASDIAAGTLAGSPASATCIDRLVFDPWRPTPSHGGHTGPVSGAYDRAAIDARTDVATYTGPVLEHALHLAGDVAAEIYVAADAPCFDLFAVLSDVAPDGKVWNLTQGIVRVERAKTPVRVAMRAVCAVLKPGHRLRLSLSAGAFPAFSVNPGTGNAPGTDAVDAQRILCLSIGSGAAAASSLFLPVVPE